MLKILCHAAGYLETAGDVRPGAVPKLWVKGRASPVCNLRTPDLVAILSRGEEWSHPEVVDELFRRGSASIDPLLAMLRRLVQAPDSEPNVVAAIGLLGQLRAADSVPYLLQALRAVEGCCVRQASREAAARS
ncbi:MAG: hypothetical protein HY815_05840, partial [Candidatus Riflebacteria bacterium]|nr:hypothetical protein [Candidatus Riflebacteria bacterium]